MTKRITRTEMKNKDKYENKNENKVESQNDEQVEAEVKEDEKRSALCEDGADNEFFDEIQ